MTGGTRAGYVIYWGEGDRRNESRAHRGQGKRRKVQRWPLLQGAQSILAGNGPKGTCRHKDLWQQIYKRRQMLSVINWIQAHTELEESIKRGFTQEDWQVNKRADELATNGTNSHQENERSKKQFADKMKPILATQRCLLRRRNIGSTENRT